MFFYYYGKFHCRFSYQRKQHVFLKVIIITTGQLQLYTHGSNKTINNQQKSFNEDNKSGSLGEFIIIIIIIIRGETLIYHLLYHAIIIY